MSEEQESAFRLLEIDDPEAGVLAYAIEEGRIKAEDLTPLWSRFDDAKAKGTKVRVLAEYHGTPSVSGGMVMDKLKRLRTILTTIERMAVVGDQAWLPLYQMLVDPITKVEIRHFKMEERSEAAAWILE